MSEIVFVIIVIALFLLALAIVFGNVVTVRRYRVKSDKFSKPLKMVFLADLLSNDNERDLEKIVQKVSALRPDIIIVAGECAKNTFCGKNCLKKLGEFSDVYLCDTPFSDGLCQSVDVNEYKIMNGYSILYSDNADSLLAFSRLDNFKIAVLPKPSDFGYGLCAKNYDVDLCLSWHSHGKVIKIPFFGALYTKEDGFLPKYFSGIFKEKDTVLVVTGGAGKSSLKFRLNNFREIVCIDIEI